MNIKAQRGVSLIEILIAVLVLAIGILGIAALQTRALVDNGSSMSQSAATAATYSILDVMRADRASAVAGNYNTTVTANPSVTGACPATGSTMSAYSLNQWCNQLATMLGASSTTTGTINCNSSGYCTITVQFDDSRATGGSATASIQTKASI